MVATQLRDLCAHVFVLLLSVSASAQHAIAAANVQTQFEVGRHTFIDVGPPNDFYELLLVRPVPNGTSVERITLTPPGDACIQTATVEVAKGSLRESIADLLGKTDPCTIPEKELRRELKRCKKCLVFSGANITMRLQCANQTRIIRADILDKDMFDPAPNTPKRTSWTMQLLNHLDSELGPGVWDRPMFSILGNAETPPAVKDSATFTEIDSGKYDSLFPSAPDKLSDLYRASQIQPPTPIVKLLESTLQPETFVPPAYPPLARLARVEGKVSFSFQVDGSGSTSDLVLENGHPVFTGVIKEAVAHWKFPVEVAGQHVQATIEFKTNCPPRQ
jgi:hypothetical protein